MEEEYLLMTFLTLLMVMNSSDLLRIYTRKELKLKVRHKGTHAFFIDLSITVKDNIFS